MKDDLISRKALLDRVLSADVYLLPNWVVQAIKSAPAVEESPKTHVEYCQNCGARIYEECKGGMDSH